MTDPFLDIAYARARAAQQQQVKRRRAAAKRAMRQAAAAETTGGAVGLASSRAKTGHGEAASSLIEPNGWPASPTQRAGAAYEDRALERLMASGLTPLARNVRCRTGEIDLIMRDGDVLVFVEVRSRSNRDFGGAAASIGHVKRERLIRSAALLLPALARRYWGARMPVARFDVVAFDGDEMIWLRAAFHL
ncbi:YraN family protein [Bordetella sp. 02P26C-1]|uniref:YraN family protein n=1 Tax=Bordetella sp. 02P26C-1 TaxID=2683195 RepID=UPI00135321E7|nr:YraN family protein [Bordetella sp. 02P26C-1]MVW79238.1 YraN family protein [Bordetella sp. 02P26C-1]